MHRRSVFRLALLVALLIVIPVAAGAFFLRAKTVMPALLARDEIIKGDYIAVGDTVDLQGNVDGDVIVAASRLTIAGAVSGDVIAAVSDLEISGAVEGDVRVAAMNVTISGAVGKSLNVWGRNVTIAPAATIERNAYAVAEALSVEGAIGRNLATRAFRQRLGGTVVGDVRLELGNDGSAEILPEAVVKGAVTYAAANQNQLQSKLAATSTVALQYEALPQPSGAEHFRWYLFRRIVSLFGMLVVGLALISLAPKYVVALAQQFFRQPAWSVWWGLIIAVVMPVAAVTLAFTVIGLPLAVMLGALYFMSLYLAQVVAGITLGIWLFQRASSGRYRGSLLLPMVAGITVYAAATGFFGPASWAMKTVAVLWGLGVIAKMKAQMVKEWR